MTDSFKHLVFYDGECGLCDHMVNFLLRVDKNKHFAFASLQGDTAKELLRDLPSEYKKNDSLILVENFQSIQQQLFLRGRAVFRICLLLGGPWVILGWISFLPNGLYDWIYRIVAKNRYRIFSESCLLPNPKFKNRFLN